DIQTGANGIASNGPEFDGVGTPHQNGARPPAGAECGDDPLALGLSQLAVEEQPAEMTALQKLGQFVAREDGPDGKNEVDGPTDKRGAEVVVTAGHQGTEFAHE